jgi:perosamine synthetase
VLDRPFGLTSAELSRRLASDGIDTRPVFVPMHLLPIYPSRRKLPISEKISQSALSLPSSPNLTADEIDYICESIRKAKSRK